MLVRAQGFHGIYLRPRLRIPDLTRFRRRGNWPRIFIAWVIFLLRWSFGVEPSEWHLRGLRTVSCRDDSPKLVYGPGAWNFDAAVSKNVPISERVSLELRAEGFDLFNHHNLYVLETANDVGGICDGNPLVIQGMKGGVNGGANDERRFASSPRVLRSDVPRKIVELIFKRVAVFFCNPLFFCNMEIVKRFGITNRCDGWISGWTTN